MHRLIIGAPFGNWFDFNGVTPTIGTYTWRKRAGPIKRAWRILKTVRYSPSLQSWRNKLELPSPGITSLHQAYGKILSIYGFNKSEWQGLVIAASQLEPLAVEFNMCPNLPNPNMIDIVGAAVMALERGLKVIVKLPPVDWMKYAKPFYNVGVRYFHACNSIPSPQGSWSGKVLKPFSLWAVSDLRATWGGEITVMGGGGITTLEDVREYLRAGASHVVVSSMLFFPWNWPKIHPFRRWLEEYFFNVEKHDGSA